MNADLTAVGVLAWMVSTCLCLVAPSLATCFCPFLAGAAAADGLACKNVLPVARLKAEESDLLLPRVGADEKLMRLQRVIAVSTKIRAYFAGTRRSCQRSLVKPACDYTLVQGLTVGNPCTTAECYSTPAPTPRAGLPHHTRAV